MPEKDELRIEYVPLDRAVGLLWRENPKLHDIQLLAESLARHGMRDAPAFDAAIQEGGGIVDGNGRVETLAWMRGQGREPPRGVLLDGDGAWCVPVQFGVDAESEAAAKAYALDANNVGYAGSPDASPWDLARMWDEKGYLALLEGLAAADALPVSVPGNDLDALLNPEIDYEELWQGMPEFEQEDVGFRTIKVHFMAQEDVDSFAALMGQKITDKTKAIWHPEREFDQYGTKEGLVYSIEDES